MLLIFGNSIIAFILNTLSQLADSLQSVVPGMSLVSSFLDYVACLITHEVKKSIILVVDIFEMYFSIIGSFA